MAGPFLAAIDHNGVSAMRFTNRHTQTICRFRHGNEMGMVWHQAITPNRYVELLAPLGHQGQVRLIVFITEEGFHSPISTLGYVMRNTGGDYTGNSRHERIVLLAVVIVKHEMRMVSPYFSSFLTPRLVFRSPAIFEKLANVISSKLN